MRNYKFYLRSLNGEWLARVQPFDPEFLCIKVHPNAVLLYMPFRSQPTLLQHLCVQLELLPPALSETGRWRSRSTLEWLRKNGTDSIPEEIRGELMERLFGQWEQQRVLPIAAPPGVEFWQ